MEEFEFMYKLPKSYGKPGRILSHFHPDESSVPKLFQPIKIRELELNNRVVVSPMCTYSSRDGYFSDFHMVHYGALAKGGAGLVILEAAAVSKEGRITYGDLGIYKDEHIKNLKRIVDFSHKYESKIGIQLAHAGRKSSTSPHFVDGSNFSHKTILESDPSGNGWANVYAPSPIAWCDSMVSPIEMTKQDIENVLESYRQSARRAKEAGFDFIELHHAHGYLGSSFLSQSSNKRNDEYNGQTFEGRIKFVLDTIKAVRLEWNGPLSVRISCEEYIGENGWTINDSILFANIISQLDVDMIDCSSGGNSQGVKIKSYPMYQVPFSHKIKESIEANDNKLLVGAVGLINNAKDAESILQENKADLILFGRKFLQNPFYTYELANQLNCFVEYPLQYDLSKPNAGFF